MLFLLIECKTISVSQQRVELSHSQHAAIYNAVLFTFVQKSAR